MCACTLERLARTPGSVQDFFWTVVTSRVGPSRHPDATRTRGARPRAARGRRRRERDRMPCARQPRAHARRVLVGAGAALCATSDHVFAVRFAEIQPEPNAHIHGHARTRDRDDASGVHGHHRAPSRTPTRHDPVRHTQHAYNKGEGFTNCHGTLDRPYI